MSESAEAKRVLHLGAGMKPTPGAVNHDLRIMHGIELAFDLEHDDWPVASESFDSILALDVLEHVDHFINAIEECHRILTLGGELTLQMPYFGSLCHATDPTHKRGCTEHTMGYFIVGHQHCLSYPHYSTARFELVKFGVELPGGKNTSIVDAAGEPALGLPAEWSEWIRTREVGGNLIWVLKKVG